MRRFLNWMEDQALNDTGLDLVVIGTIVAALCFSPVLFV